MQPLIALIVFVAVGTLAFALLQGFFSEERRVTHALRTVSAWEAEQAADAEPMLRPFRKRVLSPVAHSVGSRVRRLFPAEAEVRMRRRLALAGNPAGLTPENLVALQVIGAVVLPSLLIFSLALLGARVSFFVVLFVLSGAVAGYLAPALWIDEVRKRRHGHIRRMLPDMMDMLTISVQAGLGFDMALVKLVRSTSGPLAEEFGRMLSEVQSGGSRRDALRHLGERTEVPELDTFITAMVQADVFGVSVSGILQAQSLELRKKRRQLIEERAQKAPVKMVFPIIFCMLPATMLVVLGPAVIAIARTFGMAP